VYSWTISTDFLGRFWNINIFVFLGLTFSVHVLQYEERVFNPIQTGGGGAFEARLTFLKFNWEHFGMSVLCPTNLTLPWQPLSDNHVFKKSRFSL